MAPPGHVTRRCFGRGFYAARPVTESLHVRGLFRCTPSHVPPFLLRNAYRTDVFSYQFRISIFCCYARFCLLCLFSFLSIDNLKRNLYLVNGVVRLFPAYLYLFVEESLVPICLLWLVVVKCTLFFFRSLGRPTVYTLLWKILLYYFR